MNDDCIFCNILNGDIPSYTVYEDESTYAFLDVNPLSRGHTLVIPKRHGEELTDLNRDTVEAVFRTAHKVAGMVKERLHPDGVNLLQNNGAAAGQEVGHVHVHVIPRYEEGRDGFNFSFDQGELADDEAEELVKELRADK